MNRMTAGIIRRIWSSAPRRATSTSRAAAGNFSNWLLRFVPDEEESDEASLRGGESPSEGEDEESGAEDENEHSTGLRIKLRMGKRVEVVD